MTIESHAPELINFSLHSAPAVSYPVGRSRFQAWLIGLTGLCGAIAGIFWSYQADSMGWRQGLLAMTLLGACFAAAQDWRRSPEGSLRWDGQAWSWTSAGASVSGSVKVHLDLQFCLVLSLRTDTGARLWLWPERQADGSRWQALRRAVFSRDATVQQQDLSSQVDPDKV